MPFSEILQHLGLEDKPFYRAGEVRRIFGISRLTLFKWRRDGLLESVRIQGQHFITRASLKALCEKGNSDVHAN
jgi:hypothetical protein